MLRTVIDTTIQEARSKQTPGLFLFIIFISKLIKHDENDIKNMEAVQMRRSKTWDAQGFLSVYVSVS